VLSWAPFGQADQVWMSPAARFSPGVSLRGGIPICWPWFGPLNSATGLPAHGIARKELWEIVACGISDDTRVRIHFRLMPGRLGDPLWSFATPVHYRVTLGEALELELLTRNEGTETVTIGAALHTYWAVADVRDVRILGLKGCTYLDKLDG